MATAIHTPARHAKAGSHSEPARAAAAPTPARILVVDDLAIFREPIAAALRQAGFESASAADAKEALSSIQNILPDVIILDVTLPGMDGLSLVRKLRQNKPTAAIPIILLTGSADRKTVQMAAELRVNDYILKSRFSLKEMLQRVQKALQGKKPSTPAPASPGILPSAAPPPALLPPAVPMTRDDCLGRIRNAPQSKALSGVAGQVMQVAASPRTDAAQIAAIIARDPILSAKILRAANSAAYASVRGPVVTIADAIKQIGLSTVRNIAAALGMAATISSAAISGFNPIRAWQHCFAAATLCEHLARDSEMAGVAYLVGLCHDLGDMLYFNLFAAEHQHALQLSQRENKPLADAQRQLMGLSQQELARQLLGTLELPDALSAPIDAFHAGVPKPGTEKMARILQMADAYANGMLLAASEQSPLVAFTHAECKAAGLEAETPPPQRDQLRAQILVLTEMVSGCCDTQSMSPIYPRENHKFWLARDKSLSSFDPIEAALESLGACQTHPRLPAPPEAADIDALVVAARTNTQAF
ncbi:MAG TPA: HDOD domain-containing protein, partial [Tepidisphaeraceae bacterium]|nr:HDOD domain-containing protein [Tepidisphaeraceae bacterium]